MDAQAGLTFPEMRLILDPPQSGSWNMAADEMLLLAAQESKQAVLRLYQWNPATLSLGYFQSSEEAQKHECTQQVPWLRRSTGGGALLHDQELTYSLIFPSQHLSSQQISHVYNLVHQSLIDTLLQFDIQATTANATQTSGDQQDSFLCFQRCSASDVLLNDFKIAGSAQRRYRNYVLQHGSVLTGQSVFTPELPGILELSSLNMNADILQSAWVPNLQKLFDTVFIEKPLIDDEKRITTTIQESKFKADTWNMKR
jgi:lipoate-protein ligase A